MKNFQTFNEIKILYGYNCNMIIAKNPIFVVIQGYWFLLLIQKKRKVIIIHNRIINTVHIIS